MSEVEGLHLAQWTWRGTSGRPDDVFTNSWHFKASGFPVTDYDNVRDMLSDFYTGLYDAQADSVCSQFTNQYMTGFWDLNLYDLTQSIPRVPVYTDSGYVSLADVDGLPSQDAIVLSFQAQRYAGLPQNRRRNRVYIGPFHKDAALDGLVKGEVVEDMLFAAKGLINASHASTNWGWAVYSPFLDEWYPPTDGWVDNGWDIQRRRKKAATQRGTFDLDSPT